MKKQTVTVGVLVGGFLLAVLVAVLLWGPGGDEEPAAGGGSEALAGQTTDRRILGEEGRSGVVFTEFLDFECEACGAAYPFIEELREEYAGEVTFEARYFPLPNHVNSRNAAWAVEASARQGKLVEMYNQMFETQSTWGDQQDDKAELFRGFAEEIGLDMAQYDQDVASDSVKDRVQRDVDAGTDLGVQGTPSFFIDGERFEPQSLEEFGETLDEAMADAEATP